MGARRTADGGRVMAGSMRYSLVYGALAGGIAIAGIVATLVFNLPGHTHSELVGYLIMLAALSLIFVGVKRYRDNECGGVVRFGRAFVVGLGIAVVAGILYTAGWEIYSAWSPTDFIADYSGKMLADLRAAGASEREIAAKGAEMREMVEMYRNPLYRVPMVFMEIFPVGLIVALVSALVLRNPRALPKYVAAG